jgi:hypothetical protein
MRARGALYGGTTLLFEMAEFAAFSKSTQRYIRRSLDIGLRRRDAVRVWARNDSESQSIRAQYAAYRGLDELRAEIPDDIAIAPMASWVAALVTISAFDLGQSRLTTFGAYRFLYERLLGASALPWLPAAFCAAASLPHLHPDLRRDLIESVGEAAGCRGWSSREPGFIPEWVEKVDATISA